MSKIPLKIWSNNLKDHIISIKTGSWSVERDLQLTFPGHWEVNLISGTPLSAATLPDELQKGFNNPVGSVRLEEILKGKKTVAIVVDDHTRSTPVYDIVNELLCRIRKQGIPDEKVKLIIALGTHVLKDRSHLQPKFGNLLDSRVKIVLPDVRKLKEYVLAGTTPSGIPIHILREYAESEAKITISGIYPHDEAGFSGGAKIMIGLLGLRTLSRFHRKYGETGRGKNIETPFRLELESYADIAGIDWSINIIQNHEKKIYKIWCGDFRKAFRKAAEYAKSHLGVEKNRNADVIISNAYPLDTSLSVVGKSLWPFHDMPTTTRRILVASPVTFLDFRVPFCESPKEALIQRIKRLTGAFRIKLALFQVLYWIKFKVTPKEKWARSFVYFIPDVSKKVIKLMPVIDSRYAYFSWDALIGDILMSFPKDKKLTVSVYDIAPLHFPD
jgi:lactate racemase